jgi:hypothetical protein
MSIPFQFFDQHTIQCDGCNTWYHCGCVYSWPSRSILTSPAAVLGSSPPNIDYEVTYFGIRFHSTDDPRITDQFTCFECRLRKNLNLNLLQQSGADKIIRSAYQDLAVFRSV